ncbi:MAG: serine protein kinase RIO [Thermoplasmata archaeon]
MPRPVDILYPRRPAPAEDRRKEASDRKVLDEFFDRPTLLAISRLITAGIIDSVDHPISMGKEGGVFRATSRGGPAAIKVYRIGNAAYRRFPPHALEELRREGSVRNLRALVPAWTRREYTILGRLADAGVRVPRPIAVERNVLLLEYIGDAEGAAPRLKDAVVEDLARLYDDLVEAIRRMRERAGLVHGDLSPYNLLYHEGRPVVIDVAQAVGADHPQARELLVRDVGHLAEFLTRRGFPVTVPGFLDRLGIADPRGG